MTNNIDEKMELVTKYRNAVEKLNQQIRKIQSDGTLTDAERQKKIAHRMDIIDGYTLSIQKAEEYIQRETIRARQLYESQMNKMK